MTENAFTVESPYRPAPNIQPPQPEVSQEDLDMLRDQGMTLAFRVPTAMSMAIDAASRTVGQNRSQWLREAVALRLAMYQQALREGVQFPNGKK